MKNKKSVIFVIVSLVLIITVVGVSYAFFNYRKSSESYKFVAGNIKLNLNDDTDILSISDAFPETIEEARSRNDNVITFTIDGRNSTPNKDIYYEIILKEGDDVSNKIRLDSNDILVDLVEIRNGNEVFIANALTLREINDKRIWVDTIERNTANTLTKTYKLRMWVRGDILISDTNPNADYTTSEFKNRFANIKLKVYGDFAYKSFAAIRVSGKLQSSNAFYNVTGKYDDVLYTNENVVVTLKTNQMVEKIIVTNIDTTDSNEYTPSLMGQDYGVVINYTASGRYNYYGVLDDGSYTNIGTFNVKIDKNAPTFTMEEGSNVVIDSYDSVYHIENTLSNISDDNNYIIEYAVVKTGTNPTSYMELVSSDNKIRTNVNSGAWDLVVKVTDESGNERVNRSTYVVGYNATIDANNSNDYTIPNATITLVTDQKYNYVEALVNATQAGFLGYATDPSGTNIIGNQIIVQEGVEKLYAIWSGGVSNVTIPTVGSYCSNPVYNGTSQSLVQSMGAGVILDNDLQTNAGAYTVTASLRSGYVWTDGTNDPVTFECSMVKRPITYQAGSAIKEYDETPLSMNTAMLVDGSLVSGHTASYVVNGTITEVGNGDNVLESVTITNASNEDVTSNYNITKLNGTLTISIPTDITCAFSGPNTAEIAIKATTTYTLTCTSNGTFDDTTILTSDLSFSNAGLLSVGTPIKTTIANGYKYTIVVSGINNGSTTLTLNAGSISVSSGKVNTSITSSPISILMGVGSSFNYDYGNVEQSFIVPLSGYYTLETWGAQGGNASSYTGGYGGYSSGVVYLNKGSTLYINVGGVGESNCNIDDRNCAGGYNGGGDGYYGGTANSTRKAAGGGATHIATTSGVLSSLTTTEKKEKILIVAGGGGGASYTSSSSAGYGGAGGGYIGNSGTFITTGTTDYGTGGTQSAGGTGTFAGTFGQGGSSTTSWVPGGGGGYFGGGSGVGNGGAGGGSGYIRETLENKVMYCYNCSTSAAVATKTVSTTEHSSTPTINTAKEGNGYVKITLTSIQSNYDYTGSESSYVVPVSGYYQLETWGAQGGNASTFNGGYGGYSSGVTYLNKGDTLYVSVGGEGASDCGSTNRACPGGYNGGGDGYYAGSQTTNKKSSGGGATHIATTSGVLSSLNTTEKRASILIVAGGGGGGSSYTTSSSNTSGYGGAGGGYIGNSGILNSAVVSGYNVGTGGTQSAGGTGTVNGSFGQGGSSGTSSLSGGGGGYFGGGTGVGNGGAGGGSGYIKSTLENKIMYCYDCQNVSSNESTKTVSATYYNSYAIGYYAKSGNGYATIKLVSDGYTQKINHTASEQVFVVPVSGTYKLETWGASGGSASTYTGGYGGYSVGSIYLNKGETLYVNVGGKGSSDCGSTNRLCQGGYNGGGDGYYAGSQTVNKKSSGGGATHIATTSGVLSSLNTTEKRARILIVAGGGGGGSAYTPASGPSAGYGGSGGGYIATSGTFTTNGSSEFGTGGTQSAGGTGTVAGSFGQGGSSGTSSISGGGGGYFGGGSGVGNGGAGGGSGYLGDLENKAMYCYNCTVSNEEDTRTISIPAYSTNADSTYPKGGNGYVKITLVD